ncbi:MAG TPA: response regulator [Polyangiaceae bacterium]|nr:response regulator [Polyangiaceae bacterium]
MVLVVDDEPLVLKSAQRMFELRGFEVLTASDGPSALLVSRSAKRLDLLVTDVCLPGEDGRLLAMELRETRPGLPVLFISGLTSDTATFGLPTAGTWAFLAKPFTGRELDAHLAVLLGPVLPGGPARRG